MYPMTIREVHVHTQSKKYLRLLKKSLAISEEMVYIIDNEER